MIDDEPSISEITKKTLEKNGYRVLIANDGAEGIAQYAQAFLHKPFTAETLLRAIHHVLHDPKTRFTPPTPERGA